MACRWSQWINLALVVTVCLRPAESNAGAAPLVEAIRTHREYFRALALGKVGMESVLHLLDGPISDEMPASQRIEAINGVSSIGSQAWGSWATTGFIEDENVTHVLGLGLLDDDPTVRQRACDQLNWRGKDRYLATIADEIKQSAHRLPRECGGRLLGRLSLDVSQAIDLLGRPLGAEVRARLGDTESEHRLIVAFEQARDFRSKEWGTRMLAYVGTSGAGRALARALHSPIFEGAGDGYRLSVRVPIILALGRIHQDELALTSQILWLQQVGDRRFGGPTAISTYLDQVYGWARATYGIEPEGPEPGPFLNDVENARAMH